MWLDPGDIPRDDRPAEPSPSIHLGPFSRSALPGEGIPEPLEWPAIVHGLSAESYHATPALSSTTLRGYLRSIGEGRAKAAAVVDSPEVDIGTVVHSLSEGESAAEACEVVDVATRRARAYTEAREAHTRPVLTRVEWARASRTFEALEANPIAGRILGPAHREISLFWYIDTEHGRIPCKARIDALTTPTPGHDGGEVADIKTTAAPQAYGSPDDLARLVLQRGWHRQLAWYERGALACGIPLSSCEPMVLLCTTKPPHVCEVVALDREWLTLGNRDNELSLARYALSESDPDTWPGPSASATGAARLLTIPVPRWARG